MKKPFFRGKISAGILLFLITTMAHAGIPFFTFIPSLRAMESRRRGRVVPGSLRAGCFSAGKI